MESAHSTNYHRIAQAIAYIEQHFQSQPSLEEIAAHVHLSPFHFQRLFSEWAGVSPKQFIQYLTLQYAQQLLQKKEINLFNVALESGLSGTGRLHDLFVTLVGMTPGEYKNGAAELSIHYAYYDSPFGTTLLAATSKGLCHMAFCEDEQVALQELIARFPNATFKQERDEFHLQALVFFEEKEPEKKISLHLKGSPFQLKVWEALLKIPMGEVSSYGNIAQMIQQPSAARAVGTAIGSNPIAFLIPCHRVIQQAGMTGGYRWNPLRKKAMLGWEAAKTNTNERIEE